MSFYRSEAQAIKRKQVGCVFRGETTPSECSELVGIDSNLRTVDVAVETKDGPGVVFGRRAETEDAIADDVMYKPQKSRMLRVGEWKGIAGSSQVV